MFAPDHMFDCKKNHKRWCHYLSGSSIS